MNQKSKKSQKNYKVPTGVVHINAGFNNILIVVTDALGNVLVSSSAGKQKFKGAKKSTPYAAQQVSEYVSDKAKALFDMKTVSVVIKGPGAGRESAIRGLYSKGLILTSIKDVTPLPHNGCRPRKRRRV